MNRYPLWKYLVIVAAIIFGIIYTLPNFFGESPAVQISSVRSTVKVDTQMMDRVERILRDNQIPVDGIYFDASGMHSTIKVRFTSTDIQFKAKEVLESKLNTDPQDPTYTLSFDLLFRGMEITTGGQRIHDYSQLLAKMEKRGMTEEGMEQYLSAFKHGMPPHGGLGIGLERLTMKLVGEDNVRETTLFPRDMSRLEP